MDGRELPHQSRKDMRSVPPIRKALSSHIVSASKKTIEPWGSHMNLSKYFVPFVLCLMLCFTGSVQAKTVITFCNESSDDLFVAAAIGTGDTTNHSDMSWRERGWLELSAGECSFILRLNNLEQSDFAFVRRFGDTMLPAIYRPDEASGDMAFDHLCVNPFAHFNVRLPSYSRPSEGCAAPFVRVPTSFGVIAGDNNVNITLN